jgi:hypothetical protein
MLTGTVNTFREAVLLTIQVIEGGVVSVRDMFQS